MPARHQDGSTPHLTQGKRPAAVLAGWLGCKPRSLRRFVELYDRCGWDAVIRIGDPRSVVAAMTLGPPSPSSSFHDDYDGSCEMKRIAIGLLRELQDLNPPFILLHCFSNNGCFLWEWIRHMLFEQQRQSTLPASASDATIDVARLRRKLVGVVFDSAPAHYGGRTDTLQLALQYVTSTTERSQLLETARGLDPIAVKRRFDIFWNGQCDDGADIPRLFLFSRSDDLASAEHIEELILHRKQIMGNRESMIWRHEFPSSGHCRHLLKYPEEYERIVADFLRFCTSKECCSGALNCISHMRSKL